MKNKKITKIISAALIGGCILGLNPIAANADWLKDGYGWWYSEGSSYATGWRNIDGQWYYFNNSGYMVTDWQKIDGKWYFFDKGGNMLTGLVKSGDSDYYCDASGAMVTGWIQYDGEWHYYNEDGSAKTGWLLDNDKWYYINNGQMVHDNVIDGYEINHDGVWVEGSTISGTTTQGGAAGTGSETKPAEGTTGNTTDAVVENESEAALKAKELIYKNDGEFIEKIKQYNFKLGKAEETTIKDFVGDNFNIPDEKCYKISAFVTANGQSMETVYLVGIESGKIYGSAKLDKYNMYEFKDNKIVNIFYYQNEQADSVEWHYSTNDPVEDCLYLNRKYIKYDGKYISISNDNIKSKSSLTVDDALQLALQADGKAIYRYKFRNKANIAILKGKEVDSKETLDGKWDVPKGKYYSFEVIDDANVEDYYTAYIYMVNKETKDVYLIPSQGGLAAYKFENNQKVETCKWLQGDDNIEWRK